MTTKKSILIKLSFKKYDKKRNTNRYELFSWYQMNVYCPQYLNTINNDHWQIKLKKKVINIEEFLKFYRFLKYSPHEVKPVFFCGGSYKAIC